MIKGQCECKYKFFCDFPQSIYSSFLVSSCLIMLVLEFIFLALPHIFRAKSIQPAPKNGPYAYDHRERCWSPLYRQIAHEWRSTLRRLPSQPQVVPDPASCGRHLISGGNISVNNLLKSLAESRTAEILTAISAVNCSIYYFLLPFTVYH